MPILASLVVSITFYPSDPWQAARHDAILAVVEELRHAISTTSIGDAVALKERRQAFAAGPLQDWATNLERQIVGPFIEGERLYIADLKVFTMVIALCSGAFEHLPTDVTSPLAALSPLRDAVAENPKVAEWRSTSV